jgi:hypothetical protein
MINELEWGLSFRLGFADIGTFLRGHFPASMSVVQVGLSAKLIEHASGLPTDSFKVLCVKVLIFSKVASDSSEDPVSSKCAIWHPISYSWTQR